MNQRVVALTSMDVAKMIQADMAAMSMDELVVFARTEMGVDTSRVQTRKDIEAECLRAELSAFSH